MARFSRRSYPHPKRKGPACQSPKSKNNASPNAGSGTTAQTSSKDAKSNATSSTLPTAVVGTISLDELYKKFQTGSVPPDFEKSQKRSKQRAKSTKNAQATKKAQASKHVQATKDAQASKNVPATKNAADTTNAAAPKHAPAAKNAPAATTKTEQPTGQLIKANKNTPVAAKKPGRDLSTLPVELLEMIAGYAMIHTDWVPVDVRFNTSPRAAIPSTLNYSLLHTCRTLYHSGLTSYYSQNVFWMDTSDIWAWTRVMSSWPAQMGCDNAFKHVKRLVLRDGTRVTNPTMRCLAAFDGPFEEIGFDLRGPSEVDLGELQFGLVKMGVPDDLVTYMLDVVGLDVGETDMEKIVLGKKIWIGFSQEEYFRGDTKRIMDKFVEEAKNGWETWLKEMAKDGPLFVPLTSGGF